MKKHILLLVLCLLTALSLRAANEIYAVLGADQKTMTLYYDANRVANQGVTDWSVYDHSNSKKTVEVKRIILDASMKNARPTSTEGWFMFFTFLEQIEHLDYLNTSEVTDMSYMFSSCNSLRQVDVSGFQTGNVTNMNMMFFEAGVTSLDVSGWDVSRLSTCAMLFSGCKNLAAIYCEEDWSQQATNLTGSMLMFSACFSLQGSRGTAFQNAKNDIEYARPDKKDAPGYFSYKPQLYGVLDQDQETKDIFLTFYYDHYYSRGQSYNNPSMKSNVDIIRFDESVKNWQPESLSKLCQDFTQLRQIEHLDYLNTQHVTDMSYMFDNCPKLQEVDVSHFDTRNVTTMRRMFSFCGFQKLDLTSFDIRQVTDMSEMFNGSANLERIYCNMDWSKSSVLTNSKAMFSLCESLVSGMTQYDISHTDVSYARPNGTNPGYFRAKDEIYGAVIGSTFYLYYDKKREQYGGIVHWENNSYSGVKTIELTPSMKNARPKSTASWFSAFPYAKNIIHLDYLNTSEVTDMSTMFYYCSYLTSIDVSHFDMSKVTTTARMFEGCLSLETIYSMNDWTTSHVLVNSGNMFNHASKLRGEMGTKYAADHTDVAYARMDTKETPGYFTRLPEIYGLSSNGGKTVTLYYDSKRESKNGAVDWKAAYGAQQITKVVIDPSMANAPLTTMQSMFEGLSQVQTIEGLSLLNTADVTDMSRLFNGCLLLKEIDISAWDTRHVTTTESMFMSCAMLTTIDMSSFRIDALENCSMMFHSCGQLKKIYCLADFSASSKISESSVMFLYCASLQGSNGTQFSSYDTDKSLARPDIPLQAGYFSEAPGIYGVTSADGKTFTLYCDDEKAKRGGDENWAGKSHAGVQTVLIDASVAKARPVNLDFWFQDFNDATSFQGLAYLNTEKVTSMVGTFANCSSLKNIDLSGFKTSEVTNMSLMFSQCKKLVWLDLSQWDMSKMTSVAMMFNGCANMTTIYCGKNWASISMESDYMFNGCSNLRGGLGAVCNGTTYIDKTYARPDTKAQVGYFTALDDPQLYGVTSADKDTLTIRYDCWRATNGGLTDLRKFSTTNEYSIRVIVFDESVADARPTSTSEWFMNYASLTKIDNIQHLNTSEVTDMSYMFSGCTALTELNLTTFNTQKVTVMDMLFGGCTALKDLNISTWQTPHVKTMNFLFMGCSSLKTIDLTQLDIHNAQEIGGMFWGCSELTTIYAEADWGESTALTLSDYMFSECPKLTGGSGTTYDANHTDVTYAHVDGGTSNPGYFSSTLVPYFTVRFEDHDGTLLKEMQVAQGGNAVPPAEPTRDGYTFVGWDEDYTNIQSNLTVTARYKKNEQGLETVQSDDIPCTKLLRDGQLYLIYKGIMYNVQGRRIN